VARVEATLKGLDIRYVVTSIASCDTASLYSGVYCARGQAENLIKRHKSQLASDRTSCRSPLANQMRLILRAVEDGLLHRTTEGSPQGGYNRPRYASLQPFIDHPPDDAIRDSSVEERS
jgi:hypothetical protein